MTLKLNIGHKSGKTYKRELSEEDSSSLMNKKIGDKVKGEAFGLGGYEFEITGGSDNSGFPMRKDVNVAGKKRILITASTGFKTKRKGLRKRRTVAGNTIYAKTVQVNLKILKEGKDSLEAPLTPAEAAAPSEEAPKEEAPVEKKTEKPKDEPAEEKTEKPTEEPKTKEKPAEEKPAE